MEAQKYRVLIVDDHPLLRRGLHHLLAMEPRFDLIAEAGDGEEALFKARQLHPHLILLDLKMQGMSGLETLNALHASGIASRVVVLTVSALRRDFTALQEAGAEGYLLKDSDPEELLAQIIKVAEGGVAWSHRLQAPGALESWKCDPLALLTVREQEVLKEVASGLTNKQVAENLAISEQTVKVHIRNVLRKLNVRTRVAATVLWLEFCR
ncbi:MULTISPECIES: response regulator [Erwinia]|uniref:Response regulator n=1 Tax=Erwinia pyrifoliae TaxID=79967 RepID=A0ABY5XAS0_ERWPY|nr:MULTISPECIES: response regulator [Erwinia]ADP13245.1 Nitrate/nitrite response regulator protein NarP [Erwinia sp. Ejp617]AUX73327.1 DNA-binding response regulator [Erwinia pyrifoliae]MCA8876380.1 response regulator [Erwinia pyrifoliae]MCT2386497.1 response regulator [Erwinia pyrifoliae]MCU8587906.1 response regulator [Erwinia pyrifoliae]